MAAANMAGGEANSRAAAAGRALLQGFNPSGGQRKQGGNQGMTSQGSAGLLAMAELQRRASQQSTSMLQNMNNSSAQNFFAAAAASGSQGSAMAQMARNASGKCRNHCYYFYEFIYTSSYTDQFSPSLSKL
jgi:hypothetical protein